MSENSTHGQEPLGSGKHRGEAAPTEDSASSPRGRHRREPDGQ